MAKVKNTPQSLDLASLSQEKLLAKATELQASNEALTEENNRLESIHAEAQTEIADLNNTIGILETEKSEALVVMAEQKAELELAVNKIETLEKTIDELSQANTVKVTGNEISHAGSVFKLVTPKFWLGGQLITKEVLEADASLIASAIEHGNLVEITQE